MPDFDALLALVIGGMCTGLGSALGNYFAQRAFIRNIEKIEKIRK